MNIDYWAATDVGKVRALNEDAFYADGRLFAVADGLGGHLAGEVASRLSLVELAGKVSRASGEWEQALSSGFSAANAAVRARALNSDRQSGMGTTLTAVLIEGGDAWFAHVGDSRAYLFRQGRLLQLTRDDSLVGNMVERGEILPQEADSHPQRNIITKAIGSEETIVPQLLHLSLEVGDRILLCTDGLNTMLDSEAISESLALASPRESAERLIRQAIEAGGADNVTVVLLYLAEERPAARPARAAAKVLVGLLSVGLLVGGAYAIAGWWLTQNFFLSSEKGRVALYRGLPIDLGRVALYRRETITDIPERKLPRYYRDRLKKGIVVGSIRQARSTLRDIAAMAAEKNE